MPFKDKVTAKPVGGNGVVPVRPVERRENGKRNFFVIRQNVHYNLDIGVGDNRACEIREEVKLWQNLP